MKNKNSAPPTLSNPLDALCAKCGKKESHHSVSSSSCPCAHPYPKIFHSTDRFTPLSPWPDNVTIKVGAQYRQKSTGLIFHLLNGDSTTNQIGLYVQAPEWHGTAQDMLAEFDLVAPDARPSLAPQPAAGEAVAGNVTPRPWEWQPIETAPKNRKLIAGYFNIAGKWRTVTACYHTHLPTNEDDFDAEEGEYASEGWYEECDNRETIEFTECPPTHWMPLPPAPGVHCVNTHDAVCARVAALEGALRKIEAMSKGWKQNRTSNNGWSDNFTRVFGEIRRDIDPVVKEFLRHAQPQPDGKEQA